MSKVASGNTELAYTRKERGITIVSCMLGTFFDAVAFLLINFLVFPMSRYFHASIAEIVLSITINVIGITIGGIIFGWTAAANTSEAILLPTRSAKNPLSRTMNAEGTNAIIDNCVNVDVDIL